MSTIKGKVLVVITHEAFALNQLCLYYALEKQGGWEPVLLSTIGQRFFDICADRGLIVPGSLVYPQGDDQGLQWQHVKGGSSESSKRSIKDKAKSVLKIWLPEKLKFHLANLYISFFKVKIKKRQINYLCGLIRLKSIQVIALTETCPTYDAPAYAAAAKRTGIKLITNVGSRDNPNSYAETYKTDRGLTQRSCGNVLIGLLLPKWVYAYEGKRILRARISEIVAQEILGIASPQPWNTIGSLEDRVFVENELDKVFYEKYGVKGSRISVTGSGRQDILTGFNLRAEVIKKEVCGELGFDSSRGIILCALPQTHWISGRPEAEYQSHPEMIAAWVDALMAQSEFNVIITLHPSMPADKFKYIENARLKISRRSSFELIGICSLFVAGPSTITSLAISAGKPIVNYDVYRYTETAMYWLRFAEAEGVVTVLSHNDFADAVYKFATDVKYLAEMTRRQERCAKQWGILDGRAAERIVLEMDKLLD